MNKLKYIFWVMLVPFFWLGSCEKLDLLYDRGGFINFSEATATINEGGTYTVTVVRGGTSDLSGAVTVNFSVSAKVIETGDKFH